MKKLIIQLPALNEAQSIADVMKRLPTTLDGVDCIETIVIDDGSTDETGAIAREYGAHVVRHATPRGVGAAFRSGLLASMSRNADYIVTIDADGQFDPADIHKLMAPLLAGEADCVTASRFKDPAKAPVMPKAKRWGNDVVARWVSRLAGQSISDVSCGYRAYARTAYLRLNLLGDFTYTHEVLLSLMFAGLRVTEVPIVVRGVREHGTSRVANNLPRYAYRAASIILGMNRDYRPLQFFGCISWLLAGVGALFVGFVSLHWMCTGAITPYKAFAFVGGAFWGAALIVGLVGLLAQMHVRLRSGVEDVMYRVRRLEQERDTKRD